MNEMYRFLAAIFATLIAGIYGKPVEQPAALASEDYPRYAFHYAVSDPYSMDNKAQWEERDGDIVKGSYSLSEPDGSLRVVEYSASDGVGFNAVVKNVGPNIHPIKISQTINHQVPLVPAVPVIHPIITPETYGLGPTPISLGVPKTTLYGESSLPWDPLTGSYGGWVPLPPGPHAYIISKKVVDGHLQKVVIGPISLLGKKIIVRTKKN